MSSEERDEAEKLIATYRQVGYKAVLIDAKTDKGIQPLLDELDGCTFTLVGASGVGKSSIIQRLLPDRDLVVGAVSEATGLGSHTTSVTFWYDLPGSGAIIDSPGVPPNRVDSATVRIRLNLLVACKRVYAMAR